MSFSFIDSHEVKSTPTSKVTDVPSQPQIKIEYHDGTNWYPLATENFVLKSLTNAQPCMLASTTNLAATYSNGTAGVGATLTSTAPGALTIDELLPPAEARILVQGQSISSENGVYVVTNPGSSTVPWVLTRAKDYDTAPQIQPGSLLRVYDGKTHSASLWMQLKTVSSVGSSSIVFSKISPFVEEGGKKSGMIIPGGPTLERPLFPVAGTLRFNNES